MIDKDKIRLYKKSYNVDGKYWYVPQILFKTNYLFFSHEEWLTPYCVNYKTLETDYRIHSISPRNEYELKRYLQECLEWINKYENDKDWKIVTYDEYKKVCDKAQEIRRNKNKYVYL